MTALRYRLPVMMGFRRYGVTLHHRSGRTVDMTLRARSLEHATSKAWRWGNFENWEAATIHDGTTTVRVDAPDDIADRANFPRAQG